MAPPNLGDRIADRYELISPLRGRATTRTFVALDEQIAMHVALTWFEPGHVTSAAWAAFVRAASAAAAARVPGLVLPSVTAALPDPPYCVAEVPQGSGLDRLRERGAVDWKRALTLGERIVEIVAAVHAATGAAHRALTPARCLYNDRDEVRVLDHGVAELEREHPDEPDYRAPEQPGGDGPRVDIYTVAVILFELIAGQRPRANVRLRSLVPVPTGVDNLFARALAADPGARYPDYTVFRGALREALGLPSLQPLAPAPAPAPAPEPPRSASERPPAPIAAPEWARSPAPSPSPSREPVKFATPVAPPAWIGPTPPGLPESADSTLRLPIAARGAAPERSRDLAQGGRLDATEELPVIARSPDARRDATEVLPPFVRADAAGNVQSDATEVQSPFVRADAAGNVRSDATEVQSPFVRAGAAGNVRSDATGARSPMSVRSDAIAAPVNVAGAARAVPMSLRADPAQVNLRGDAAPVNAPGAAPARGAGGGRGAAAVAASTPLDEQRTVTFTPISRPRPTPAPVEPAVEPPAELARTEVDGVRRPEILAALRAAAEARPGRPAAAANPATERTVPDNPVVPGISYSAIEGTRFVGDIGPLTPPLATPEVAASAPPAAGSGAPLQVPPPTSPVRWSTQQILIAVNVVCVVLIVLFVVIARGLG
jgi:hypothetical protein